MNIKRRTLIKFLILGAIMVPLSWFWVNNKYRQLIEDTIRTRLHFLDLDNDGLTSFCNDYLGHYYHSDYLMFRLDLRTVLNDIKGVEQSPDSEDEIIRQYLLSTDFFPNKADESKLVSYMAYRAYDDRYNTYCSNPFATII